MIEGIILGSMMTIVIGGIIVLGVLIGKNIKEAN